jgi:hypothetical protein
MATDVRGASLDYISYDDLELIVNRLCRNNPRSIKCLQIAAQIDGEEITINYRRSKMDEQAGPLFGFSHEIGGKGVRNGCFVMS